MTYIPGVSVYEGVQCRRENAMSACVGGLKRMSLFCVDGNHQYHANTLLVYVVCMM